MRCIDRFLDEILTIEVYQIRTQEKQRKADTEECGATDKIAIKRGMRLYNIRKKAQDWNGDV